MIDSPMMSFSSRRTPFTAHLPGIEPSPVFVVNAIAWVAFTGTVGILAHSPKRHRLHRLPRSREQSTVLAISPGAQDKAALPAGGQVGQRARVKANRHLVARTEYNKAIIN